MTTKPASNKRWWLWLPMLAIAAWLALFGDKSAIDPLPSAGTTGLNASQRKVKPAAENSLETMVELIPREQLIETPNEAELITRDLFADRSWTPAPSPVIAPEPPLPTAPALPFTYLGKQLENNQWRVFLGLAEQIFVVSEGSTINDLYKVDAIAPPNLSLTYLPLGQSQSLSIGETR